MGNGASISTILTRREGRDQLCSGELSVATLSNASTSPNDQKMKVGGDFQLDEASFDGQDQGENGEGGALSLSDNSKTDRSLSWRRGRRRSRPIPQPTIPSISESAGAREIAPGACGVTPARGKSESASSHDRAKLELRNMVLEKEVALLKDQLGELERMDELKCKLRRSSSTGGAKALARVNERFRQPGSDILEGTTPSVNAGNAPKESSGCAIVAVAPDGSTALDEPPPDVRELGIGERPNNPCSVVGRRRVGRGLTELTPRSKEIFEQQQQQKQRLGPEESEERECSQGLEADTQGARDEGETPAGPAECWDSSLSQRWAEVEFMLREPILTDQDLTYSAAASEAGLIYMDKLNSKAKEMGVLQGQLSRWLLPYDAETSVSSQIGSHPAAVLDALPPEAAQCLTAKEVTYLIQGATGVRRLVRVKMADDADLATAKDALKTLATFFAKLSEEARRRGGNCSAYSVLEERRCMSPIVINRSMSKKRHFQKSQASCSSPCY
ncbi:unnamed protein product [Chrysoparadoxa australica]